jgi:hypothetical protein
MSIFDKLGPKANEVSKKAGEVAQVAAKKSKQLAATARVNLSIATENDKIKKAQIELGKLYYKDFVAGTAPEAAEYLPWCEKITASLKTIDALNESLVALEEEEPTVEVEIVDAEPAAPAEEAESAEAPAEEEAPAEYVKEAAEAPAAPAEEPPVSVVEAPVATLYVDETNADID